MRSVKVFTAILLLVLALGSNAWAQRPERALIQGYGAYVPTGGGVAFGDAWAVGGLLGLAVGPHLWLMGSYGGFWHGGVGEAPGWRNRGYFGIVGYDIVPQGMNGDMIFFIGAGGVRFERDAEPSPSEAHFALTGGVKLVFDLSRHVSWTLDAAATVADSDEGLVGGDTRLFPLAVGLAVRF